MLYDDADRDYLDEWKADRELRAEQEYEIRARPSVPFMACQYATPREGRCHEQATTGVERAVVGGTILRWYCETHHALVTGQ